MIRKDILTTIGVVLLLVLAIIVAIGKDAVQLNRQGDAAIFEQLIDNIHAGRGSVSNVFANTQDYIENKYATKTTAELIELNVPVPASPERNMLGFHSYYILYPISLLNYFFSSSF